MSDERRPKSTVINAEPSLGEVEELLRAAQEDLLLKLSVDTHTTSRRPTLPSSSPSFSSSSSLHPDLRRRFDALRSHRAPTAPKREPPDAPSNQRDGGGAAAAAGTSAASAGGETSGGGNVGEDEVSKILGDDLAARFAALKGSSSSYLPAGNVARNPDRIPKEDDGGDDDSDESDDDDDDGVSKKEVEKLMQWAMDAARLDPDPSNSDDGEVGIGEEGGGGGGESAQDEEDDAAARADEKKKKGRAEGKNPPTRKWFFF